MCLKRDINQWVWKVSKRIFFKYYPVTFKQLFSAYVIIMYCNVDGSSFSN